MNKRSTPATCAAGSRSAWAEEKHSFSETMSGEIPKQSSSVGRNVKRVNRSFESQHCQSSSCSPANPRRTALSSNLDQLLRSCSDSSMEVSKSSSTFILPRQHQTKISRSSNATVDCAVRAPYSSLRAQLRQIAEESQSNAKCLESADASQTSDMTTEATTMSSSSSSSAFQHSSLSLDSSTISQSISCADRNSSSMTVLHPSKSFAADPNKATETEFKREMDNLSSSCDLQLSSLSLDSFMVHPTTASVDRNSSSMTVLHPSKSFVTDSKEVTPTLLSRKSDSTSGRKEVSFIGAEPPGKSSSLRRQMHQNSAKVVQDATNKLDVTKSSQASDVTTGATTTSSSSSAFQLSIHSLDSSTINPSTSSADGHSCSMTVLHPSKSVAADSSKITPSHLSRKISNGSRRKEVSFIGAEPPGKTHAQRGGQNRTQPAPPLTKSRSTPDFQNFIAGPQKEPASNRKVSPTPCSVAPRDRNRSRKASFEATAPTKSKSFIQVGNSSGSNLEVEPKRSISFFEDFLVRDNEANASPSALEENAFSHCHPEICLPINERSGSSSPAPTSYAKQYPKMQVQPKRPSFQKRHTVSGNETERPKLRAPPTPSVGEDTNIASRTKHSTFTNRRSSRDSPHVTASKAEQHHYIRDQMEHHQLASPNCVKPKRPRPPPFNRRSSCDSPHSTQFADRKGMELYRPKPPSFDRRSSCNSNRVTSSTSEQRRVLLEDQTESEKRKTGKPHVDGAILKPNHPKSPPFNRRSSCELPQTKQFSVPREDTLVRGNEMDRVQFRERSKSFVGGDLNNVMNRPKTASLHRSFCESSRMPSVAFEEHHVLNKDPLLSGNQFELRGDANQLNRPRPPSFHRKISCDSPHVYSSSSKESGAIQEGPLLRQNRPRRRKTVSVRPMPPKTEKCNGTPQDPLGIQWSNLQHAPIGQDRHRPVQRKDSHGNRSRGNANDHETKQDSMRSGCEAPREMMRGHSWCVSRKSSTGSTRSDTTNEGVSINLMRSSTTSLKIEHDESNGEWKKFLTDEGAEDSDPICSQTESDEKLQEANADTMRKNSVKLRLSRSMTKSISKLASLALPGSRSKSMFACADNEDDSLEATNNSKRDKESQVNIEDSCSRTDDGTERQKTTSPDCRNDVLSTPVEVREPFVEPEKSCVSSDFRTTKRKAKLSSKGHQLQMKQLDGDKYDCSVHLCNQYGSTAFELYHEQEVSMPRRTRCSNNFIGAPALLCRPATNQAA